MNKLAFRGEERVSTAWTNIGNFLYYATTSIIAFARTERRQDKSKTSQLEQQLNQKKQGYLKSSGAHDDSEFNGKFHSFSHCTISYSILP